MKTEAQKLSHRLWQQRNKDKVKAANKRYFDKWILIPRNREKWREYHRNIQKNRTEEQKKRDNLVKYNLFKTPEYKMKRACRNRTDRYLKKLGIDKHNQVCEVNGCYENAGVHHMDYTNHFYIRWLCTAHHGDIHRGVELDIISHF